GGDDLLDGGARGAARWRAMSAAPSLRPYQLDTIERVESLLRGGQVRHPLIVAPTGSGKTVVASELVTRAHQRGEKSLFLVHRRELIRKSSNKPSDIGLEHGIIAAGFPTSPDEPAQVASIQTLHSRAIRGTALELPPADWVFVDEAHHI